MFDWFKRNSELHGWAMLVLTAFVYLGQGGRGYITTTLDWIIQYDFGGSAGDSAVAIAYGLLPWNVKFLIGLISDNLPIMGYNVKPWMALACLFGIGGQVVYGFEQFSPNLASVTIAYTIVQYYGATVDCLADALVVKNGRSDEEDSSSSLQSLSWFSLGIGGALFTFVGSQMSTDLNAKDEVSVSGSRNYNKVMLFFPISLFFFIFFVKEKKTDFKPSLKALLQQIVRLFVALFSPPFLVLRVAAWIVISKAAQISLTSAINTFHTSELKINPSWKGYVDIVSYLFLSVGVVVYYKFFRYTSFRKIFFWSQLLVGISLMADYVLVKRWNQSIGFPDIPFLFASSAFD
jgi:hypothetical protein